MLELNGLLKHFVQQNITLLSDNLVGIYLHGSAAMGCWNGRSSDLDLLVVVNSALPNEVKRKYMDMVVELNKETPGDGIELHVVRQAVCNPFVYPTPFELHFSAWHLERYLANPEGYVEAMKGPDRDLAAHVMVLRHRGKTLYGKPIRDVFGPVSKEEYFDSIWHDIANARKDILDNPMYIILNLCRVLAYVKHDLVLSKSEGGRWGLTSLPERFRCLVQAALDEYEKGTAMSLDNGLAIQYAGYMLAKIKRTYETLS